MCRIQIRSVESLTVFGIYVTQIYQFQYMLYVESDITVVQSMMKEVLDNKNETDTRVMAAFRK